MGMVIIGDPMISWVWEIHDTGVNTLSRLGQVNGIVLYEDKSGKRVVPLDLRVVMQSPLRHRPLVEDSARLMMMTTEEFEAAVAAAGMGRGPLPGDLVRRWLGMVLRRLQAIQPRSYVISGECSVMEAMVVGATAASAQMAKAVRCGGNFARGDAICTMGFTPIRSYLVLTPFRRSRDGVKLGQRCVRDSMAGQGWLRGPIGEVYAPSLS